MVVSFRPSGRTTMVVLLLRFGVPYPNPDKSHNRVRGPTRVRTFTLVVTEVRTPRPLCRRPCRSTCVLTVVELFVFIGKGVVLPPYSLSQ